MSQRIQPGFNAYGASGTAVSSTTTYRGQRTDIGMINAPSYQLRAIGTMTGTWKIQVSDLPDPVESTDTDWVDLTLAVAITQPAGSDSKDFVGLAGLESKWMRPVYTNASGSGTISAFVGGKE
jgi:hypothetical protein